MSKEFSSLVKKIKPSFTLQMTARAAELRSQGEDVINFGVGEPDFNTPEHIIEAGKQYYHVLESALTCPNGNITMLNMYPVWRFRTTKKYYQQYENYLNLK